MRPFSLEQLQYSFVQFVLVHITHDIPPVIVAGAWRRVLHVTLPYRAATARVPQFLHANALPDRPIPHTAVRAAAIAVVPVASPVASRKRGARQARRFRA